MYLYLGCILVVFLSEYLECFAGDIISDISDDCSKGQIISTYLTSGMGVSDTFVAMIAKEGVNCSLNFLVNKENYIIVVIEFLDWFFGKTQCGGINNEVNVMVRKKEVVNICYEIEDNIIRKVGKNELSVSIKSGHDLQTVKITATSLKVSRYGKCRESEVGCVYENQVYCMAEESQCDGNSNCGVRNRYDENTSICKSKNYNTVNPGMVIVGLVIVFVTFCMVVALLKKLLPNREGTFILKEDETLSEKDRATSEKDFQVQIRVLYDQDEMNRTDMDALTGAMQEETPHLGVALRKTRMRKKELISNADFEKR